MSKKNESKWTRFMDMHSGGGTKESFQYLCIEAPEDEATVIFYNRFGHNPNRVSCTCCGEDYSISDGTLQEITAYDRGCHCEGNTWVEEKDHSKYGGYKTFVPFEDFMKNPAKYSYVLIPASEIKPEERIGTVPQQGYIWQD